MRLPTLNGAITFLVGETTYQAVCTDVFDGSWCCYLDAAFPKTFQHRFSAGEQCTVLGQGGKCLADFVSYPTAEQWKVRFLISK
jgi:hypothetical protein